MRFKKNLLILSACFTFGFAVNANAYPSCSGTSVDSCSGDIPKGSACSGYYISQETKNEYNKDGEPIIQPGRQCSGNVNACTDGGGECE